MSAPPAAGRAGVPVVAEAEVAELWLTGRGPLLLVAFSALLSVISYLVSSNTLLNFLEQREAVGLVLEVAVAVSALVCLVAAADSVSGERERKTLESLLLTPAARPALAVGKLAGPLSLWAGTGVVAVPYLVTLGRGPGIAGRAVAVALVVSGLLAAGLACLGVLLSAVSASNRVSLAGSLFLLLALFAPTQLPTGATAGSLGGLLLRINPVTAAESYANAVVVKGHGWTRDLGLLASPVALLVAGLLALAWLAPRVMTLERRT